MRADRLAYLIDGEAYFRALADALVRARRSIVIVGWDIDARVCLPDPAKHGKMVAFTTLLDRIARRRKKLHIYLLSWDFAALFALERQPFPALHLGWATHERVHFVADAKHPPGASHHQKLVVIDDRVAFSGGLDVAIRRWDTREHSPVDARRIDPNGLRYPPFHDVQIMVSGPAARALGDVARERWRLASGRAIPECDLRAAQPWPAWLVADALDADVVISRTEPAWAGEPGTTDVKSSLCAAIGAARRLIYIENQYLACDRIASALARRLSEADGPEVVIVAPSCCSGWLEKRTMGVLRGRFVARVRAARFAAERFRIVTPHVDDVAVFIHSKVMVIDDAMARVGSANLCNRSMSLDTECDVTVLAGPFGKHAKAVSALRDRLLAEHLGLSEAAVHARLEDEIGDRSLVRLVDEHVGSRRRLLPVEERPPSDEELTWVAGIANPERPLDAPELAAVFGRYISHNQRGTRALLLGLAALAMIATMVALSFVGP